MGKVYPVRGPLGKWVAHRHCQNESLNAQPQPFLHRPPPQNVLSLGIGHHISLAPSLANGLPKAAPANSRKTLLTCLRKQNRAFSAGRRQE